MPRKIQCGLLLTTLISSTAWAQVYNNAMSLISVSLNLLFGLCVLVGVLFIGIALTRYQQFRQNPAETPLSRVLFVLFFGIALLVLPCIAQQESTHQVIQEAATSADR
jgi:hypothetical protein